MSPFRKITQQLNDLELKSPELEDFSTPVIAPPDLWPRAKTPTTNCNYKLKRSNSLSQLRNSSSFILDIDAIHTLQHTVRAYNEQLQRHSKLNSSQIKRPPQNSDEDYDKTTFQSLPANINSNSEFEVQNFIHEHEENHYNSSSSIKLIDLDEQSQSNLKVVKQHFMPLKSPNKTTASETTIDFDNVTSNNCIFTSAFNARFLDTKMMSTSPSANYYRPTEEPEPLDLTQLNIEASVMCLVSKIKFLCGRCGSPAIRLRHPKVSIRRSGFSNNLRSDPVDNGNIHAIQSSNENNEDGVENDNSPNGNSSVLNLLLTQPVTASDNQMVTKKGNKFTDGKSIKRSNIHLRK